MSRQAPGLRGTRHDVFPVCVFFQPALGFWLSQAHTQIGVSSHPPFRDEGSGVTAAPRVA
jgi:hypothetical protein